MKIVSGTIKKEIQVISHLALERGKEGQQRLPVKVTVRVSSKEAKQASKRQQGDCSKKSDSDLEIYLNFKSILHILYYIQNDSSKCLCIYTSTLLLFKSCPTLSDPIDYTPKGSSVHGTFQARILEWVAISFSRGSSRLRE